MEPLRFHAFGDVTDPLRALPQTRQNKYIQRYLAGLKTGSIVEEPLYFDRDYLADYTAYYATSARRYPNVCRRLHFFAGSVTREDLSRAAQAASGSSELEGRYLGFCVLRPVPDVPFGRTVLRWFPDTSTPPRCTEPVREYVTHLVGLTFRVRGIAWQQQDSRLSACATVALWSLLHSSAFDERYAIPTTAMLAESARQVLPVGDRVVLSPGLTIQQICEIIRRVGLAPVVSIGDIDGSIDGTSSDTLFSREKFMSILAALVRSGFPVMVLGSLVAGKRRKGRHATCAIGFRQCTPATPTNGSILLQDADTPFVYVHDDNIGPAVRFAVEAYPVTKPLERTVVALRPSAPADASDVALGPDVTAAYPTFVPTQMVAAVHPGVRTSPDHLHGAGLFAANLMVRVAAQLDQPAYSHISAGLSVSFRLLRLHRYLGEELGRRLAASQVILSQVRFALCETVPPMCLDIGLARIGSGGDALIDILFDTTDHEKRLPVFCCVTYDSATMTLVQGFAQSQHPHVGVIIPAF